ncbi:RcnB family protein [Caulobacter sp. UNC358MFTsu5.1]|uniref:RcnB family protein n=1 Tax=Caulobacter sp. UNC358MFTsu5.1 TaxID=1449049 RepID=UPI0004A74A77|nr:RcnB family protein [Caulobacter sp. UNC358MFTsu5.1]
MKRLILTLLAATTLVAPLAARAQTHERHEDRRDRVEDRVDRREDRRDRAEDRIDRREDHWDRVEDRVDRREDYWDRANREWWRGRPEFVGYVGVRPGYGFAPGYGYYRIAPIYSGRRWAVGGYVPADLRRYVVVTPAFYRLRPAPRGYAWIYVGNDIALVAVASGLITEIVRAVW